MGLINIVNVFRKHRYALGDGFNTFPSSNYDFSSDFMLCGTRTCSSVLNNNNLLNGGCRLWPFFSHISRSYTQTLFWSRSANVPPARRHLINLLMILCSWGYVFFPGDGTQTRDNESLQHPKVGTPAVASVVFLLLQHVLYGTSRRFAKGEVTNMGRTIKAKSQEDENFDYVGI